jgi:hypothetical protein
MTVAAQSADAAGWIQTYTGKRFCPTKFELADFDISDIANALARQCRYAGHCLRFYSVAEHCVHVCDKASPENQLAALMHDASEAYLVDIPRPIKPLLVGYAGIEASIMSALAERYKFEWPLPSEVKHLDAAIITDERAQNMALSHEVWETTLPAIGAELQFWAPEKASFEFLARFYRLGGHH